MATSANLSIQDSVSEVHVNANLSDFEKSIRNNGLRDISDLGQWRASTSKGNHDVCKLKDGDLETYWQSDGDLPHAIEIRFSKLVNIGTIGIYLDYVQDESYTPRDVVISAGFGRENLSLVLKTSLGAVSGWEYLNLQNSSKQGIECMFLKMEINRNHQNGRDCHIRQLRIAGPTEGAKLMNEFRL